MIVESVSIIIILLAIFFIFLRRGRGGYSILILPLIIVPAGHVVSYLLAGGIANFIPLSQTEMTVCIDVAALLITCIMYGFLAKGVLSSRKARQAYLLCCGAFSLILTLVYLINTMRIG